MTTLRFSPNATDIFLMELADMVPNIFYALPP